MDKIGLAAKISIAVLNIDAGRKGFATKGKAEEGRISFEEGIASALILFREAQVSTDTEILILAEYTFICQELELCDESDKEALSSLTLAKQSFDDAFLALQVVENSASYKEGDKLFPHHKDYRTKGFPRDAYHIAINSHKTRIKNALRVFGVDPIEKALLKQRLANLETAKTGYLGKQKKAMAV